MLGEDKKVINIEDIIQERELERARPILNNDSDYTDYILSYADNPTKSFKKAVSAGVKSIADEETKEYFRQFVSGMLVYASGSWEPSRVEYTVKKFRDAYAKTREKERVFLTYLLADIFCDVEHPRGFIQLKSPGIAASDLLRIAESTIEKICEGSLSMTGQIKDYIDKRMYAENPLKEPLDTINTQD